MDTYITIAVETYEELIEARTKMNIVCRILEKDAYPDMEMLRQIVGVDRRPKHDLG